MPVPSGSDPGTLAALAVSSLGPLALRRQTGEGGLDVVTRKVG
jgi:hypothetical protein